MSPLRLWDLALRKYRVLQRLEQQYNDAQITQVKKLQAEAMAFAHAVHASANYRQQRLRRSWRSTNGGPTVMVRR